MADRSEKAKVRQEAPVDEPRRASRIPEWVIVLVIAAVAAALLLTNLGGQCLWQDEAQTALISKTILTHGIPMGRDGQNSFSQESGAELSSTGVYKWHTWLPFYVTAASFLVLGVNTLAARFPFALFGVATIVLVYFYAKLLWGSRRAGVIAAVLMLMSVPFLILCRNCRYYAPEAFFSVLALYAYSRMLMDGRRAGLLFVIATVLLFHSHYGQYGALLVAVWVFTVLFRRDKLKATAAVSGISIALVVPWVVYFSGMSNVETTYGGFGKHVGEFSWEFLRQIVTYVFPLWMLAPLALVAIVMLIRRKQMRVVGTSGAHSVFLLVMFLAATLLSVVITAPWPFFRYLVAMIPILLILAARIIDTSMEQVHPAVGMCVLAAVAVTSQMPDFYYELTHRFNGPIEGIVSYLNKHAKPGDIVAITYEDLPVKFYTKLRVIGGLTGESLDDVSKARWVIVRKYYVSDRDAYMRDYIEQTLPLASYDEIMLDSPDTEFENREEPDRHFFRTQEESLVIIYRKPD